LEFKFVALEENIIETPNWSGQDSWNTRLSLHNLQDKVDGTLASITSSP